MFKTLFYAFKKNVKIFFDANFTKTLIGEVDDSLFSDLNLEGKMFYFKYNN